MPNLEMLNINDEFMDFDKNINPDMFWKMTIFKLLNKYLDPNYNFLFEDDMDVKKINDGIVSSKIQSVNYQNDIISKIPKPLQKICNMEYNENYYGKHYEKCIKTDIINIIRLYTNINQKQIITEEMKNIELNNLKFNHFHINYTSNLKFSGLYDFNKLDTYLINYFKKIDILPNSIIMINFCKFDEELNYFIIEYQPEFEIKTLYDYYCLVTKVHDNARKLNYNYTINSLSEEILNKNKPKTIKYGYEITLEYSYCFIRKGDKQLKFNYNKSELILKYPSKKTHSEECIMIKMLYSSGLKRIVKTFCKIFLNISLNDKLTMLINQIEVNNEIFICKNNDNSWIVPNPDNIIFK